MASNDANTKFVNYTFNWRIDWAQYEKIGNSTPANCPLKYFTTAYNNVVFLWHAYLRKSNADDLAKIGFYIEYEDGPLETIKGVDYKVEIVKNDGSVRVIRKMVAYDANRGKGYGNDAFDDKDSTAVRTKYELQETDALVYQITMRLPMETFAYAPTPTPNQLQSTRHADRLKSIQDPESSKFSDAILVSRDGTEFYCHKVIVSVTEPLETLLSDPLAALEKPKPPTKGLGKKRKAMDSENDGTTSATGNPSTDGKKRYKFKEMATSTLKAMIEYLYTGQSTLNDMTVTEIIAVANATEQYLLKPLKELCVIHLWKRVAVKPASAFEIIRFADLHDDCKYLKYRALDVMAENYQELGIKPISLAVRIAGTHGKELRNELMDYIEQRLRPFIGPW